MRKSIPKFENLIVSKLIDLIEHIYASLSRSDMRKNILDDLYLIGHSRVGCINDMQKNIALDRIFEGR